MTAKRGASQGPDEGAKKVRKPYTITKSRESWTEAEHQKFLEALQLFDRDWKKIEAFVGTKTVIQIRSHAQKYILKVQKNGTGEHVPPPRPKRKSAQPYPQKAQKSGSQSLSGPPALPGPSREEIMAFAMPSVPQAAFGVRQSPLNSDIPASPWIHHSLPPPSTAAFVPKDPGACVSSHGSGPAGVAAMGRVKGALEVINSSPRGRSSQNSNSALWQRKQSPGPDSGSPEGQRAGKGAPDFSSVYRFIGSVFDPQITGHLKRLKELPTIDRETVVLLMRNLAINLECPEFEQHRLFLNVYDPTTNPAISDAGFGLQAPTAMDFSYDDDPAYMEGGGHGGMGMPSWPMAAIEDGLASNDMHEMGLHQAAAAAPFSSSTQPPPGSHLQAGIAPPPPPPPPQQRWWRGDPRSMQASHKAAAAAGKNRHMGGVQVCQSPMYGVP